LKQDYLRPQPMPHGALRERYRNRRPQENEEETRAVRASFRPKKTSGRGIRRVTLTADGKKRVALPGAKPGDVFEYTEEANGHFRLVRLSSGEPPRKMTRAEIRKAIQSSKLKFDSTWKELRAWTREP
jgi:hypothetical protein